MPRILVHPEYLREFSAQWLRAAGELQALCGRVGGAIGGLDWKARQQASVEGAWAQARGQANSLVGQAEAFARYLATKAQAFEDADYAGASAVGQVMGMFVAAQRQSAEWWQRFQTVFALPRCLLNRVLRLGQVLVETPLAWVTTIVTGISGLLGVRALRPLTPEWQRRAERAVQSSPSPAVRQGLPPPSLQPADPAHYTSCALYAQARRPDLIRPIGGDGGAYNYIELYENTRHYYRLPTEAVADLRTTPLKPGVAVVWDKGTLDADPTYGHIAIIEKVEPGYIEVSEAGWGNQTRRRIPADQLPDLHFIL